MASNNKQQGGKPAAKAPAAEQSTGLEYLGTLVPPGQLLGRARAALPVVVQQDGRTVGVVVLSDPGMGGESLKKQLANSGYGGKLELVQPSTLDRAGKEAVARCIVMQKDATLDRANAIAAFGFTMDMMGL